MTHNDAFQRTVPLRGTSLAALGAAQRDMALQQNEALAA